MNQLQQKVNDSANFYNESFRRFDYQLAEYNFRSLEPFFKGKLGLELGPASGYMTKLLVNEFETLHVVEGAISLLNQIPDYENVVKHHSFFEDFEPTLKYDSIIMSHVLEHIMDPIFILKKIYSWLEESGVFLVSVPNSKSIHRLVVVQMGLLENEYQLNDRDHSLGHYRVYDIDLLKSDLLNAGFNIIESGGVFLKPVSNSQIEKTWTPEMIMAFTKPGNIFRNFVQKFLSSVPNSAKVIFEIPAIRKDGESS